MHAWVQGCVCAARARALVRGALVLGALVLGAWCFGAWCFGAVDSSGGEGAYRLVVGSYFGPSIEIIRPIRLVVGARCADQVTG